MKKISFFLICALAYTLVSCSSGSTLRTARVLQEGQFEISAGIVDSKIGNVDQVIIAAYGVTDQFELEARYEANYFAITPRLQLMTSEKAFADCLAFFELGYSERNHFQWGPGVVLGRRFDSIEPYVSYRFRHYSIHPEFLLFREPSNVNYVKFGTRLYLPLVWMKHPETKWFIGFEVGPTISSEGVWYEWALNCGFDY